MELKNNYFQGYIGQPKLKNKLTFLLDSHKKTKVFEPILLVSKRGDGKTDLARRIGNNLLDFTGKKPRKFVEINSASVSSISAFVDNIVIPHVSGNQEVTVFCDEFAKIHRSVEDWLLSVIYPNKENITEAIHDGIKHQFNYKYFSFIGATTDARLLSLPMKSRLRRLEFEPYSGQDLIKILHSNTSEIQFRNNVESEIVQILRGSPRETVYLAKDIKQYCKNKEENIFALEDWLNFKFLFDILPLGLTRNELQLLLFLKEGAATLTCLAAKFNLEVSELRREIELYPMAKGLISIDGKRKITQKGMDLLKLVDS